MSVGVSSTAQRVAEAEAEAEVEAGEAVGADLDLLAQADALAAHSDKGS
jgi:hypothetical protein